MKRQFIEFGKLTYRKFIGLKQLPPVKYTSQEASDLIEKGINSSEPFLCARLGCTELQTMIFAEKALSFPFNILFRPFWKGVLESIHNSSGVFNVDRKGIYSFVDLYKSLMPEIDILGSWHPSETYYAKELSGCTRIRLGQIGPDIINDSWLKALRGKKVLVVNSFTDTIQKQYAKRKLLFENPNVLPEFKELILIKSVQSAAGENPNEYKDWFEALYSMRAKMEKVDYDIALIGCGAYGLPLAAWAKQAGKKVILIGGSLQLLFGIKGKRWENCYANTEAGRIMNNPNWVKPSIKETPQHIEKIPGSGYW